MIIFRVALKLDALIEHGICISDSAKQILNAKNDHFSSSCCNLITAHALIDNGLNADVDLSIDASKKNRGATIREASGNAT